MEYQLVLQLCIEQGCNMLGPLDGFVVSVVIYFNIEWEESQSMDSRSLHHVRLELYKLQKVSIDGL